MGQRLDQRQSEGWWRCPSGCLQHDERRSLRLEEQGDRSSPGSAAPRRGLEGSWWFSWLVAHEGCGSTKPCRGLLRVTGSEVRQQKSDGKFGVKSLSLWIWASNCFQILLL